jgi:hypothetical protein
MAALFALVAMATAGALFVLLTSAIWGHWGGGTVGLTLYDSYITEYLKHAPNWRWLTVGSFAFAVLLQLLALGYVLRRPQRLAMVFGSLLLASASMGNFFMAYAPVRAVNVPDGPAHEWWTPEWWFRAQTAHTPYERGMADAYSDVHYRAIRLVLCAGLLGMLFIGSAEPGSPWGRRFAMITWLAVLAMAVLFISCERVQSGKGLVQRGGFVIMYGWLWLAWHHCFFRTPRSGRENVCEAC